MTSARSHIYSICKGVIIKGKVMTTPCYDPVKSVYIKVFSTETGEFIGSGFTGDDGNYEIWLAVSDANHLAWPQSGVYPNPFSHRTKIEFFAPVSGNYLLNVTDVSGKKVLSRKWELQGQQLHVAVLSVLDSPGVYLANISGSSTNETFRLIQAGRSSSRKITAEVTMSGHKNLPLKSAKADSITLVFDPYQTHYAGKDTVVAVNNYENLDVMIQNIPQTITAGYAIYVYDSTRNVAGARVVVSVKNKGSDEFSLLLEGETNTQGHFSGSCQFQQINCSSFIIRDIEALKTEVFSPFHDNFERVDEYTPELDLEVKLNRDVEESEFSFRILPYTADNVPLSEFLDEPYQLHFINRTSGETWMYEQSGDSAIVCNVSGYPDDVLQVWHLNEKLADFIVIEHPDQYWTDKNIAQNRATYLWDHILSFDTLKTTINEIANHKYNKNKPLELYTPRYEYEVEGYGGGGATLRFADEIFYRMLTGRGDGGSAGYIKNWKLEGITHIDKIFLNYRTTVGNIWDNSEPISQEKLDEMMNIAREVLKVSNSASGRVRLPYVEHVVKSKSDSIVQAAEARGWDETSISYRYYGTPNNSLSWDNENLRIKYGTAKYDVQGSHGAIFEEEFEHLYGTVDPVIGSSAAYIFELDNNNKLILSTFARTMGAVSAMSNPGTRLLPANK